MTSSEYIKLYKSAHSLNGTLTAKTIKILQKAFKEAGELAAKQVLKTTAAGLSDLTSSAWSQIERQLIAGADLIAESLITQVPPLLSDSYNNFFQIDSKYIMDAVNLAGVTEITKTGIKNIGLGVNFDLLKIQADRIYQDGYSFSDRVWNDFIDELPIGVHGDYQYRIKNLILTGQAQGRDVIDIADDIQQYIVKGKDFVFKEGRYGRLIPGTAQYKRRISKKVDWRALRLVRSELNASLQEAGIMQGKMNPGAKDLINWMKTSGNPIDLSGKNNVSGKRCIDLQRANPHKPEDVNSYNHPNCSCYKEPVLKKADDFLSELKDWQPGDNSEMDSWYNDIYLPAQG